MSHYNFAISVAALHSNVQMRYANNSNYKNDTMIRKEAHVSKTVIDELRRILLDSEVRMKLQWSS